MIKKADKKKKEIISESRIKQENIDNYRGKESTNNIWLLHTGRSKTYPAEVI